MNSLLDGSAVGLVLTGAVVAVILVAIAAGAGSLVPRWRGVGIPLVGFVLVIPLLIVMSDGRGLSRTGLLGLLMLAIAGFAIPARLPAIAHGAASIPGAALLSTDGTGPGMALVLIAVPIGVTAVAMFEEGHDYEHGLSAICAAVAGGGAFLTVPDTEHIALIAGAGVVVGLAVLAQPRLTLGASRSLWMGAFIWAVVTDGVGRTAGIVGAIGAIGLLLIDPAVRANLSVNRGLLTYLPTSSVRQQLIVVGLIQTGIAVFASRVAGLRVDVAQAILLTLLVWGAVGVLLARRARSMP